MANRIVTPRSNVKNVNIAHLSVTLEYSFISTNPKGWQRFNRIQKNIFPVKIIVDKYQQCIVTTR